MSAEALRRAADAMRGEYETDPYRLGRTMRAVADWLEAESQAHVHDDPRLPGGPAVYDMPGMDAAPAVRVARAYLGSDA